MLADQLHRQAQARLMGAVGQTMVGTLARITLDRTPLIRAGYATATARLVSGGQRRAANLAAVYVRAYAPPEEPVDLSGLDERLMTPDSPGAIVGLLRLWSLLDEGVDEAEARTLAGDYASGLAERDLKAASRVGLQAGSEASGQVMRWRLEPNPGACEWCQFLADTGARYLSAESVPEPHSPPQGGVCNCQPALELV